MTPLWPFFVFRLFYLFVHHFFDKHYAATSYGDRFSSVLLQLNFALQHHVRRQTWFSHGEFILASLLQATVRRPRILWNRENIWNLHRGTSPILRAMLSLGQNWSLHRAWLKAQRLCPIRLISIIADHATQSKQSIRLPSIATLATEIAANFGSTKWTTSFFGSPEIIPWFFRYLIIGTWDGGSPFADFPENQFPVDTVSPTPTVPAFPALGTGVPVDSFFFANWSQVLPLLLLLPRSPMAFLQTSHGLLLRDFRVWHPGVLLILVLLRQLHRSPWNSHATGIFQQRPKKTLLGRVGVCVEHLNRCKTSISLYCQ